MESEPNIEPFDFKKSPISEAYLLLGATTPFELSRKYTEQEQVLFKNHTWDYEDSSQTQNQVREILENVDDSQLTEDEREWKNEILWFWYHHAISVANWKKDKEKMKEFSTKALEFQENPNILTRTMYLLSHDKIQEAEEWLGSKESDPDHETGVEMLENYKNTGWLW